MEIREIDWNIIKDKLIKIKEKHDLKFDEQEIGLPINRMDLLLMKKKLLELNKLLRTKYKIEELTYTKQQIKECSEKRCEYIIEEQSKMIDSILEREKKFINLDRCIIKDDNSEEILLMEKDEVLKAVKDHFNKISNMTKNPKQNFEKEWENEYTSLEI